jgi:hypothetical protein
MPIFVCTGERLVRLERDDGVWTAEGVLDGGGVQGRRRAGAHQPHRTVPDRLRRARPRLRHCGRENVIDQLASRPHPAIVWPAPTVTPGMDVDEVLPAPLGPPTLEQRVAALEQART